MPARVGERVQRGPRHPDDGTADRRATWIAHGPAHDAPRLPPAPCATAVAGSGAVKVRPTSPIRRGVHVTKSVTGRKLSKSTNDVDIRNRAAAGTVAAPACAGLLESGYWPATRNSDVSFVVNVGVPGFFQNGHDPLVAAGRERDAVGGAVGVRPGERRRRERLEIGGGQARSGAALRVRVEGHDEHRFGLGRRRAGVVRGAAHADEAPCADGLRLEPASHASAAARAARSTAAGRRDIPAIWGQRAVRQLDPARAGVTFPCDARLRVRLHKVQRAIHAPRADRGPRPQRPACPKCGSRAVQPVFSPFFAKNGPQELTEATPLFERLRDAFPRGPGRRDRRRETSATWRGKCVKRSWSEGGRTGMREALVRTEGEVTLERQRLADAERRGRLAGEIQDQETWAVAERFAAKHRERVGVLERKLAAQREEVVLAERESREMQGQLRSAGHDRSATEGSAAPSARGAKCSRRAARGPAWISKTSCSKAEMDRAAREARTTTARGAQEGNCERTSACSPPCLPSSSATHSRPRRSSQARPYYSIVAFDSATGDLGIAVQSNSQRRGHRTVGARRRRRRRPAPQLEALLAVVGVARDASLRRRAGARPRYEPPTLGNLDCTRSRGRRAESKATML